MSEQKFSEELHSRTSEDNATRIMSALKKADLLSRLTFLKNGQSTSVFDINDSNLVLKVFDRRERKNPRIYSSRFLLRDYYHRTLGDKNDVNVVLELEPKLSEKGVTPLHQEMLRYKLWTEEGQDFWDILPPASNPREIKNTLLDYRGVPFNIDEDAVRKFTDEYQHYPSVNGRRADQQYLQYRENTFDQHGRPDSLSDSRFCEIKDTCAACDWPVNQATLFKGIIDESALTAYKRALNIIEPRMRYAVAR